MNMVAEHKRLTAGSDQLHRTLRQAVDPTAVGEAIERAFGQPVSEIAVKRVHLSKKRPATIEYRLRLGEGDARTMFAEAIGAPAEAHADNEVARLSKSRRRQISRGGREFVSADPKSGLVFRSPGLDARLPGLMILHDQDEAKRTIAGVLGLDSENIRPIVRLVSHRLGKRAILRIEAPSNDGAVILYARLRPANAVNLKQAFVRDQQIADAGLTSPAFSAPRPIALAEGLSTGFYEGLQGLPMDLGGPVRNIGARRAVKALGGFQSAGITFDRIHSVSDEVALLRTKVAELAFAGTASSRLAARALQMVEANLSSLDVPEFCACHRDFHEGQIILGKRETGILDFDTACMADPMLDLGNLLAHVHLAEARTGKNLSGVVNEIRSAAPSRTASDDDRLAVWTQAAMVRLGCVHMFDTDHPTAAVDLIEKAIR